MEKPTYTAIDYNSLENRVIEGLVGDYYQMVKNTFETVLYGRIHIQDSPRGFLNVRKAIGFGIRFGLPSWI